MGNEHLLVIEDENEIRELMEIILRRQGYQLTSFSSIEEFSNRSTEFGGPPFSLMILDWMLPGQSGFEFLKAARKKEEWRKVPIIVVTAKAEPDEIVMGLEAGADDYLVKPFDAAVLVARVRALLRRRNGSSTGSSQDVVSDGLRTGSLNINLKSYEVSIGAEKLSLTPTEFKLLVTMVKDEGRVFTREQLVKAAQGEGINVIGRTVDTHVFSLRKKLGEMGHRIETARGIGYRFREDEGVS